MHILFKPQCEDRRHNSLLNPSDTELNLKKSAYLFIRPFCSTLLHNNCHTSIPPDPNCRPALPVFDYSVSTVKKSGWEGPLQKNAGIRI
ncbi:hypothetical protein CDAR_585801 [Caerostris darwini]|uniref:Uncharacterized protein n=1 Tax=Caerostris darwini TaxID=1538125 RepID=A0AAV4TQY4_9ARAC|nr:hypothetical protein CDAR_585801 [Caerostris darwini]